jgi:hypothetical protein
MNEFKVPKEDHKYRWTNHVIRKMQYYGLTPSRILRVIRAPERTEDGVAEGTLAAMQTAGTKARPWEIWTMWKDLSKSKGPLSVSKKVIITAWRYPGVSPVRERVPIPSDILAELENEGLLDE